MRLVRLTLVCCGLLLAQKPVLLPAPESPEIYFSFFRFHDDLSDRLEKTKAKDAARGQRLEQSAASLFNIDPSDLVRIRAVTRSVVANLDGLAAQVENFKRKAGNTPHAVDFAQFDIRRRQILLAGVDRLRESLSAASWTGLHTYIIQAHAKGLHPMPAR